MHTLLLIPMLVASPAPERIALVIALNGSLDREVAALRFADDDGARYYELLEAFGYETVLLSVLDADTAERHPEAAAAARPPTWEKLGAAVRELRGRVHAAHKQMREVELVVTYSGHAAVGRREEPYVNLSDHRLYRGDFYRDVVTGVGADFVHLIVDACRARDFQDARGGPDGPDFDAGHSLFLPATRRVAHPELGVVVSESGGNHTHEGSGSRAGVFAHQAISALAGGADVNGDGRIEYSELHAFVAAANHAVDTRARVRVSAQPPPLNPRRSLLRGGPRSTLVRVRTPVAGGRFRFVDERGVRWLEAHLANGHQTSLALPRRRYRVIDVDSGREAVIEPRRDGAELFLATLTFAEAEVTGPSRRDLLRMAYGAAFYRGFVVATRYPSVVPPGARLTEARDLAAVEEAAAAAAVVVADADPLAQAAPVPASTWSGVRVLRYTSGAAAIVLASVTAGLAYSIERDREAMFAAEPDAWETTWSPGDGFNGWTAITQLEAMELEESLNRRAEVANILFGFAIASGVTWALSWLLPEEE